MLTRISMTYFIAPDQFLQVLDRARQILFLIVPSIGVGCLFQTPLIGLQAAMPVKDMPVATATLGLLRQLGGTVGISAGGAIYINFLRRRLRDIQGYDSSSIPNSELINRVQMLKLIQPDGLKDQVIDAYATSISSIWSVSRWIHTISSLTTSTSQAYLHSPRCIGSSGRYVPPD